jgi:hypothetical protein
MESAFAVDPVPTADGIERIEERAVGLSAVDPFFEAKIGALKA